MRKGSAFVNIIFIILVLASLGAAAFFYLSIDEEKNKIKHLQSDLEAAKVILQHTEDKLTKKDREALSLSEKNKVLTIEVSSLRAKADQLELAKSLLDKEIGELTAKKSMLEAQVTKVMKAAQEQVSLKDKDIEKKLDMERERFLIEKEVLDKQIKSSEVLMKNLINNNQVLSLQLEKNKLALEGLHRDKIGSELLATKDQLKEKEAMLEKIISENERLIAGFYEVEQEKSELKNQLEEEKTELQKELEGAQQELKRQTAKFHYNLGLVYDQSKRFQEALSEYKRALKLSPDDPDTHYNLGVLYDEAIKDQRKAIYHYKAYLDLCPLARDYEKVELWIRKAEQRLEWGQLQLIPPKGYIE